MDKEQKTEVVGPDGQLASIKDQTQEIEQKPTETIGDVAEEKEPKREFLKLTPGGSIVLEIDGAMQNFTVSEIISDSGVTGEAVVYKVKNEQEEDLALKVYRVLSMELEPNSIALERIQAISDADILPLIAFGMGPHKIQGKYCWELQVFAKGGNLCSVNNLKEKYTPVFLQDVIIPQLLNGIWKLHDKQIYHCDLKPQNIFYLDKAQLDIVLGDYGSAKTKDSENTKSFVYSRNIRGTRFYVPPEFQDYFIKDNSDYFSMGFVLMRLLYSELFAKDAKAMEEKIILKRRNHEPLIDYNPNYAHLNKLIEGCTLDSWDMRWGRAEIIKWQKRDYPEIFYRSTMKLANALKLTRNDVFRTIDEFVAYCKMLNPDQFHDIILQDEGVYNKVRAWLMDELSTEDGRNLNQIRNIYGLKGKYYVREAILRYLQPDLPLKYEGDSFPIINDDLFSQVGKFLIKLADDRYAFNPALMQQSLFQLQFALLMLLRSDPNRELRDRIESLYNFLSYILEHANETSKAVAAHPRTGLDNDDDFLMGKFNDWATKWDNQEIIALFELRIKLLAYLFANYQDELPGAKLPTFLNYVYDCFSIDKLSEPLIDLIVADPTNEQIKNWIKQFLPVTLSPMFDAYNRLYSSLPVADYRKALKYLFIARAEADPKQRIYKKIATIDSLEDGTEGLFDLQLDLLFVSLLNPSKHEFSSELASLYTINPESSFNPDLLDWMHYAQSGLKELTLNLAYCANPHRGLRLNDKTYVHTLSQLVTHIICETMEFNPKDLEFIHFLRSIRREDLLSFSKAGFLWKMYQELNDLKHCFMARTDYKLQDIKIDKNYGIVRVSGVVLPVLFVDLGGKPGPHSMAFYQDAIKSIDNHQLTHKVYYRGKDSVNRQLRIDSDSSHKLDDVMQSDILKNYPDKLSASESPLRAERIKQIHNQEEIFVAKHKADIAREKKERDLAKKAGVLEGFNALLIGLIIAINYIALNSPTVMFQKFYLFWIPGSAAFVAYIIWLLTSRGDKEFDYYPYLTLIAPYFISLIASIGRTELKYVEILFRVQLFIHAALALIFLIHTIFRYLDSAKIIRKTVYISFFGVLTVCALFGTLAKNRMINKFEIIETIAPVNLMEMKYLSGADFTFQGYTIKLSSFFIASHETTVGMFKEFVNDTNYITDAEKGKTTTLLNYDNDASGNWRNPGFMQNDSHPVVCVSHNDAIRYCNWLSRKNGYKECYAFNNNKLSCDWKADGYRLPTEAEWEIAARGGLSGMGFKYSGADKPKQISWYKANAKTTKEVKKKKPNELGLYDMSGNVWEWTWDYYLDDLNYRQGTKDPHVDQGNDRVLRGGSWFTDALYLVPYNRYYARNSNGSINSSNDTGFRVVQRNPKSD